jgi:preprotein translocase subunit YajC
MPLPYRAALGLASREKPKSRGNLGGLAAAGSVAFGVAKVIFRAHLGPAAAAGAAVGRAPRQRVFMFISPAFAQGGSLFGMGGSDNMLVSLLPFILIFVIMYFLILRPQQKRQKQHQDMVKNVRRGDTVVTNGGLVGKVTKVVDDDVIEVELADEVRVRQMRSMLADVRAKGEPVKEEGASS